MNTAQPIPDYDGRYSVTPDGRVFSGSRELKAPLDTGGYPHVRLALGGGGYRTRRVHCLVLLTFAGPRPAGHEGCHGNGDKTDNHIDNLRWDTSAANKADALAHGKTNRGTRNGSARLVESDVIDARRRAANGEPLPVIAASLGVSLRAVRDCVSGRRWGWLDADPIAAALDQVPAP